mmetsp:Transcript_10192/g.46727  ORF Transcript_10192/g.46727 Transcript_10192/m.46727 type:complete len:210 (+) Transcript_10192:1222-1851(+)
MPPAAHRNKTSADSTTDRPQSFLSYASTLASSFCFLTSSFVSFFFSLSFSSRFFALISTAAENLSPFFFFAASSFVFFSVVFSEAGLALVDAGASPVGRVVLILDMRSSSSSSAGSGALPVAGGGSSSEVSPSPRVASVADLDACAPFLPNGSPRLMPKEVFAWPPSSSRRESHLDARARIRPPRSLLTTLLKRFGTSSSPSGGPWCGL